MDIVKLVGGIVFPMNREKLQKQDHIYLTSLVLAIPRSLFDIW